MVPVSRQYRSVTHLQVKVTRALSPANPRSPRKLSGKREPFTLHWSPYPPLPSPLHLCLGVSESQRILKPCGDNVRGERCRPLRLRPPPLHDTVPVCNPPRSAVFGPETLRSDTIFTFPSTTHEGPQTLEARVLTSPDTDASPTEGPETSPPLRFSSQPLA